MSLTNQALLPRLFPLLYLLLAAFVCYVCSFNGLYGQDTHEYLRQSMAVLARLQGLPMSTAALLGDAAFGGGYPLVGGLLQGIMPNGPLALQIIALAAAALCLVVFERLVAILAPGARVESRWAFVGLGLAFSPLFFRSAVTIMSDGLGLLWLLLAFYAALRLLDTKRGEYALGLALGGVMAVGTRFALLGILWPLVAAAGWFLWKNGHWRWILAALLVGIISTTPYMWMKGPAFWAIFEHGSLGDWSVVHFFQRSFTSGNGFSQYRLPNILYILSLLAHPAFCSALPGLFFLFKRTDLTLSSKKILVTCMLAYLILLGGFSHQSPRHLLPAYTLLLLLLFPAWDRLYCYGFLFFKRITGGVLLTTLAVQLFFLAYYLRPVLARNALEQQIAQQLKTILPEHATLYGFDLDVAMRSYLPNVRTYNLWETRYHTFQPQAYILFHPDLRTQWSGQNPMLNWDDLQQHYRLVSAGKLPGGWGIWEIQKPE